MVDNQSKSVGLSILEITCSITAFLLCWIGTMRCDFIKFTDATTDVSLQFGLWRYQGFSFLVQGGGGAYIFESCNYYPETQEIDATWKTAQAFAIIAFIFGLCVLVGSCVSACVQDPDTNVSSARGWLAPLYVALTIFQGLTLLFMSSNACNNNVQVQQQNRLGSDFPETCSLNTGANLIISATVLWFAAAVSSYGAARMAKKDEGGEADVDVELADKVEAAKAENEEEAAKVAESGASQ